MPKPYSHALVVLSGGQDSTTCLFLALREAERVSAVTFNYGQRHVREIDAARAVARMAGLTRPGEHEVVEVGPILLGTSPLVDPAAKVEEYASAAVLPGGIEKTFVPMRNALFLVLAYNRAAVKGCDAIYTGVGQEDYGGYPDCRAEFIDAMQEACRLALGESVPNLPVIRAPLLHVSKEDTAEMADNLPGCMEALAYSHTCYQGEYPPCGKCHACLLREKGFALAGLTDPLVARAEAENRL